MLTVPGSSGSQAVTGLGGTPAAVFFFGVNFTTEDAVVSSSGTGISRGMVAPQWDDPGTLLTHSAFVSPAGDQSRMDAGVINSLTTAGNASAVDVTADVISLDSDGFTVLWANVTSGRKLIWVALMNVLNCGGYVGTTDTLALGWKAGASLLHGGWLGPTYTSPDEAGEYYGGAAYPGTVGGGNWMGAGLAASGYPSHSNQWIIGVYNNAPATSVTQGGTFIGPSLSSGNVIAVPTGTGLLDFRADFSTSNGGMVVVWDDEDSATGRVTPAQNTGDTVTVSGLSFAPGLVIGYSISDEPDGQSSGSPVRGAVQLSVQTKDFQWAGIVDDNSQSAYQTLNRGFIDTIDGSDLHAGTIELTQDGFILTTEEDAATANDWVWHAFGHPDQIVMWVPHIYRRVLGHMTEILDRPPDEPDGDDQAAKTDDDTEVVTEVELAGRAGAGRPGRRRGIRR